MTNDEAVALQESEERFRLLVTSVKDYAILVLDPEGRVVTWNEGAGRLKGYTSAEIIGQPMARFYPPEEVAAGTPGRLLALAAAEGRCEDEGWRVRKDGARFFADVVITAMRDKTGKLMGFSKITRDVTAQKQAEAALRESEERFRLLVTGVKDYAILILDPEGRVVTWNEGAERLKGYTSAEIIGQPMARFYPPEDVAAGTPGRLLALAAAEGRCEDEGWRVRKDGARFFADVVLTAMRDETGKLIDFAKITRDITAQKHAEAALRESEERFRLLVTGVKDYAILILDPEGRVVTWNEGAERLKGYTSAEIIGQPMARFYPPEDVIAGTPARLLARAAAEGRCEDEGWRLRKDGTRFFADVVLTAMRDGTGKLVGFAKITRDITAQKHAEAALRESEERFRSLIADIKDYAILMLDPKGRVMTWNEGAQRLKGYTSAEIIGQPMSRFYSPEDVAAGTPARLLARAAADGRCEDEGWRVRKDGTRFFADVVLTAMRDGTGKLTGFAKITRDITEQKRTGDELWRLAHHDSLTGQPNRLLAMDRIGHALERASRRNERLGLLFVDLDNFKRINDTLGHNVGDEVLRVVAQRLQENVRAEDTVARLGGDEFLLIIDRVNEPESLAALAIKIEAAVSQPVRCARQNITPFCSVGISVSPEDGARSEALVRAADMAMYAAKERGGRCFAFYSHEMTERALRQSASDQDLKRGLEHGELRLYYQPKIAMKTGQVIGYEALIRWEHPDRGMLGADDIIPVAERSGLIVEIGDWVVWQACRQARIWSEEGLPPIQIAINVSASQMRRGRLVQTVIDALDATGISSSRLEIEITESILQNEKDCLPTLTALRNLGVYLSIDDFGTGFSCLSSLKTLPINQLKIDQSFVRHIPHEKDAAIISAIITMAHRLDLEVVAEGVENHVQEGFLRAAGCDRAQGFLYAKPMPPAAVAAFMEAVIRDRDQALRVSPLGLSVHAKGH